MDIIQWIKENLTISQVARDLGIDLKQKGNSVCPFNDHDDVNASFSNIDDRGFYCHGCKRGGSVIDLVIFYLGTDIKGALEWFSRQYGISLKYDPEYAAKREKKAKAIEAIKKRIGTFRQLTEEQKKLLRSRGASDETITRCRFDPGGWKATDSDIDAGIKPGITKDRIVIPLIDDFFTAWKPDWQERDFGSKYMHRAGVEKPLLGKECIPVANRNKKPILLTEGVFDFICIKDSAGLPVVCTLGTSLSEGQKHELLKADKVVCAFDNDNAGYNGAIKLAKEYPQKVLLFTWNKALQGIENQQAIKDINDLYKASPENFKQNIGVGIKNARHILDILIEQLGELPEGAPRDDFLKFEIIPVLAREESITAGRYRKIISKACGVTVKDVQAALREHKEVLKGKEKPQSIQKLQSLIIDIACDDSSPATLRYLSIFTLVKEYMAAKGVFYQTQDKGYYFRNDEKILIDIDNEKFLSYVSNLTNLSPSDTHFKALLTRLKTWVMGNGVKRDIHEISFFDKNTCILYLHMFDGRVLKITGDEQPSIIDNGITVLFKTPDLAEPWDWVPERVHEGEKFLDDFCTVRLASNSSFDEVSVKYLLKVLIIASYFHSLMAGLPVTLLLGEAFSGKTLWLQRFLKIILGSMADVDSIRENRESDFTIKLINSKIIGIDNVDSPIPWLPDLLAIAATNGILSLRKLYTTSTILNYRLNVQMFLTARTPVSLRRDDIASRLVVIRLKQFNEFSGGEGLIRKTLESRNAILSAIVDELNSMLRVMKTEFQGELPQVNSGLRLQDFASLVHLYVTSKELKRGGTMNSAHDISQKIFTSILKEQHNFLAENDPTLDVVIEFINKNKPKILNLEIPASEFFRDLHKFAQNNGVEIGVGSPTWLGRRLTEKANALKAIAGIEFSSRRISSGSLWTFKEVVSKATKDRVDNIIHYPGDKAVSGGAYNPAHDPYYDPNKPW